MSKNWEKYEDVAVYLLNQVREQLHLKTIEGKQNLVGQETGTEWEVDAKGISQGTEGFILIECRRYTTSRQNQEKIAALAFRIQDTRAQGGIIVSPLGLQAGARKIASAKRIISVEIDASSTPENFTMKFLNQLFLGVTVKVDSFAEASLTVP